MEAIVYDRTPLADYLKGTFSVSLSSHCSVSYSKIKRS
jgi:hypothetical protein